MSRGQRLASLAVAAVIAIVAVVVLRPGAEEADDARQSNPSEWRHPTSEGRRAGRREHPAAPPKPHYETIRLKDGKPVGGARDITARSGETVRLAVRSDRAEEIHIHGYDRSLNVGPGKVTRVRFPARLEGVFEIEGHSDGTPLANLRVEP